MRLLVTGRIGIGKSTALGRALTRVGMSPTAGIRVERIEEDNRRTGFALVDIATGRREVFAHESFPANAIGCGLGTRPEVFDRLGVAALAGHEAGNLVVIDELGMIEAGSERFPDAVAALFASGTSVVAIVQARALDWWLDRIGRHNVDEILDADGFDIERLEDRLVQLLVPVSASRSEQKS